MSAAMTGMEWTAADSMLAAAVVGYIVAREALHRWRRRRRVR